MMLYDSVKLFFPSNKILLLASTLQYVMHKLRNRKRISAIKFRCYFHIYVILVLLYKYLHTQIYTTSGGN